MLSKNKIKLIRSLGLKKNRLANGLFVAEGEKLVFDLLRSGFIPNELYCTTLSSYKLISYKPDIRFGLVEKEDLSRISFLKTTPEIVAVFKVPQFEIDWDEIQCDLTIALDTIQDPGNLGTIVRLADWFGIRNIVCSKECADLYNPKAIQATMGAFAHVKVHYVHLPEFLGHARQLGLPIYGASMEGENLYKSDLTINGIVLMGNEGNGISDEICTYISRKINIPSFPTGTLTTESLNVAMATSVICSEFRRRVICKG